MCCGALCDKRKAQQEIDRMQRVIDKVVEHATNNPNTTKELKQILEGESLWNQL